MPDSESVVRKEITEIEIKIDDLLKRALIEVGEIRTMEERLAEIASRTARLARPSEQNTPPQR